ncbi:MAG: Franean1_4349 family RiPP [Proteobacteria bacterium]|nr:Franean1_4349 family RiPP [Pseudomonadota bacterium]
MAQEAVERVLGRLITDERFRRLATDSLDLACRQEGYSLTSEELRLLSDFDVRGIAKLAGRLNSGLCRANPRFRTLDSSSGKVVTQGDGLLRISKLTLFK